MFGFISLPIWGYIIVLLLSTHITILGVTLYLHRCQAHRSLELHPAISHFFRGWLWLTTGMKTKAWASVHRKHHAKCETVEDPHSPIVLGLSKVLWEGAELYKEEANNKNTLTRYGQGTPDDWLERNIYTPHSDKGIFITLIINLVLFGFPGLTIWALQMMWIPFFAAGVINGVGHYFGYRNFECPDASTNIIPIGILLGGEELHNNHHTYPTSAKFSAKWWEFDIGWLYIKLLSCLGLAKIKRTIPSVKISKSKHKLDMDTLKSIVKNRYPLVATYTQMVLLPIFNKVNISDSDISLNKKAFKTLLVKEPSLLKQEEVALLDKAFSEQKALKEVTLLYKLREQFQQIWNMTTASNNELLQCLHDWCLQAEKTGIKQLKEFVAYVHGYTLKEEIV